MKLNIIKGLALVGVLTVATAANAAIDVTEVTTGITEAKTALNSIITALMSLSVGLFGLTKVYAFIKRRAGA